MRNEGWLRHGVVAHVSPTIEPLVGLHGRLEEEMDARRWIHLATGRDKASVRGYTCAMFTTGVLVTAWWDVVEYFSVLIYDESHDRSTSYSELFNMVKPFVDKRKFKLIVMSATLNPSKVYDFFGDSNCNTVNLERRLYPLYRFEPEVPIVFDTDEALVDTLVELAVGEAVTYFGGILVFVRGQLLVEGVVLKLQDSVKTVDWLEGWRVLPWFSRADDEAHDDVKKSRTPT